MRLYSAEENSWKKSCLIACSLLFLYSCSTENPGNNGNIKRITDTKDRVAGEYLVKLTASAGIDEMKELFKSYGIKEITSIGERLYKMKLNEDPGPEAINEIAEKNKCIEYAEPNYIYRINPPRGKG